MCLHVLYSALGIVKTILVHKVLSRLFAISQHTYLFLRGVPSGANSHRFSYHLSKHSLLFATNISKFSNCQIVRFLIHILLRFINLNTKILLYSVNVQSIMASASSVTRQDACSCQIQNLIVRTSRQFCQFFSIDIFLVYHLFVITFLAILIHYPN